MVEEPTRSQNILDLVITNNPSRVRKVKVLPGISDHDCSMVDLDIRPIRYNRNGEKYHSIRGHDGIALRQTSKPQLR